jgi:hypothetical protein
MAGGNGAEIKRCILFPAPRRLQRPALLLFGEYAERGEPVLDLLKRSQNGLPLFQDAGGRRVE